MRIVYVVLVYGTATGIPFTYGVYTEREKARADESAEKINPAGILKAVVDRTITAI